MPSKLVPIVSTDKSFYYILLCVTHHYTLPAYIFFQVFWTKFPWYSLQHKPSPLVFHLKQVFSPVSETLMKYFSYLVSNIRVWKKGNRAQRKSTKSCILNSLSGSHVTMSFHKHLLQSGFLLLFSLKHSIFCFQYPK